MSRLSLEFSSVKSYSVFCFFCLLTVGVLSPCNAQPQLPVQSRSDPSLGIANLPADSTKFAPNIVPPEAARNASTSVVGATAAERNNATLIKDALSVSNGSVVPVKIIAADGDIDSGDVVSIQRGNQSTKYVAVATTTNASNNKTTATLVAGLPVVDLTAPWVTNRRLPKTVLPLHYDVFIQPNLTTEHFAGNVTCILELLASNNVIQLHSSALNISDLKLYQVKNGNSSLDAIPVPIAEHFLYTPNEFLIIKLNYTVNIGRYLLNIRFNGTMNNAINGMYRAAYKNQNNTATNYMVVTQMEPTYARRVFPCFDEPAFKATFSVSIAHESQLFALSNMPELTRQPSDEGVLVVTVFAKSPPMSTYLTCFIVTDLKFIEARSSGGTLLRAYGIAQQIDKGNLDFALHMLKYTVDRFEKYFEIPYQLPKLDIIGIPDFLYGAMENWGCITFRETNIVFDPSEASVTGQEAVASTVAHEVAHQWFGNLVTTAWWDSLWLNEGFATRMQLYGVLGFNASDDFPAEDWFIASQTQSALRADSLISSHPIVDAALTDPDDISANFDDIPYSKGGTILLMLEDFMGAETFRKGIVRFLKKHLFNTATSDDLWLSLNEQLAGSGCGANSTKSAVEKTNMYDAGSQCVDVKQVMDTWILQMNYPVLNLSVLNDTNGLVQQQRFLVSTKNDSSTANKTLDRVSTYNYSWYIPVTARNLDDGQQQVVWANQSSAVIEMKSSNSATTKSPVLLLNVGSVGFYRVNYPLSMWTELADRLAINISAVSVARERGGLISDAFEFARVNFVPYSVPFSFLRYLKNERSPAVWLTATDAFKYLNDRLLSVPEAYYLWRKLMQDTIRPVFADIGWEDVGSSSQRRLRELLMSTACYYGDPDCLLNARRMFSGWLYNGTSVPPSFRRAVYKYGMLYAENDKPWQLALDRLLIAKAPQEVQHLLVSLTSSSQPWQLQRLLQLGWNETYVRNQDIVETYRHLSDNPVALPYAWNFYRTNLPRLVEKRTLNDAYLGHLPLDFAEHFNEPMQLDEMNALFEKYPEAGAGRLSRRQALETIRNNIGWLRQHNTTVIRWLNDHQI